MLRTASRLIMPVFLFFMWLAINDTAAPGQMVLGAFLAVALTLSVRSLRPLRARPRRLWLVPGLLLTVLYDIVVSNLTVMKIICTTEARRPRSGFVQIPLTLRDPHGLAALACILTYTPGSVWVDLDEGTRLLTLHVLDVGDESGWTRLVVDRYERVLLEIFE